MTDAVTKEHFNLFYIFEEDKKEHTLPKEKLNKLRQAMFSVTAARPPTKICENLQKTIDLIALVRYNDEVK